MKFKTSARVAINHSLITAFEQALFSPTANPLVPKSGPTASLSLTLWQQSETLANAALQRTYMQELAKGSLSPITYTSFTVQDAKYCSASVDTLGDAQQKSDSELMKKFFSEKIASYEAYSTELLKECSIGDPDGIVYGKGAEWYSSFESNIGLKMADPAYSIVAMLPCSRLWPWLATQLAQKTSQDNLYQFWIEENASYYTTEPTSTEQFLDAQVDKLDQTLALAIYKSCMIGECNFFGSMFGDNALQPEDYLTAEELALVKPFYPPTVRRSKSTRALPFFTEPSSTNTSQQQSESPNSCGVDNSGPGVT